MAFFSPPSCMEIILWLLKYQLEKQETASEREDGKFQQYLSMVQKVGRFGAIINWLKKIFLKEIHPRVMGERKSFQRDIRDSRTIMAQQLDFDSEFY